MTDLRKRADTVAIFMNGTDNEWKDAVQKVMDECGPLSLWTKSALDKHVADAVKAERERCAKVCRKYAGNWKSSEMWEHCAEAIEKGLT